MAERWWPAAAGDIAGIAGIAAGPPPRRGAQAASKGLKEACRYCHALAGEGAGGGGEGCYCAPRD